MKEQAILRLKVTAGLLAVLMLSAIHVHARVARGSQFDAHPRQQVAARKPVFTEHPKPLASLPSLEFSLIRCHRAMDDGPGHDCRLPTRIWC